jgi:hypothetical protein
MVTATQTVVLVDSVSRRPEPIPDELRELVLAFEGNDVET